MTATLAPEFALWTDEPALAHVAVQSGVDYVGPDLEWIDKRMRQPEAGARISDHRIECLSALAEVVPPSQRFVRCNPLQSEFQNEVSRLIEHRVSCIMLPMARSLADVREARRIIDGRARLVVMIEQASLLDELDALLSEPEIHAFYIGTNDLSRSMGYRTRFGAIADGTLERLARRLTTAGRRFGFLGLSRDDDEFASPPPVSPRLALSAMSYLGASWFLFARTFEPERPDFAARFERCRERIESRRALGRDTSLEDDYRVFLAQCEAAERAASAR